MPHPMSLQVMGINIHEYNSYSPAKKARFQKEAHKRIAELHETDIAGYSKLTSDTVKSQIVAADELAESEAEDKENI